jgi:ADP-ribose pyrophosphatase
MKSWRTVAAEPAYRHPLMTVETRTIARPGARGKEAEERTSLAIDTLDWVHVVPVLPDGRIVMVRQWRYATESFHLELPGGIVEDGDPRASAEAELAEETGYRAGNWQLPGEVEPNPAILDNRLTLWLASDLQEIPPGERPPADPHEEFEVVPIAPGEVAGRIAAGEIRQALVISSFYLNERYLDRDGEGARDRDVARSRGRP